MLADQSGDLVQIGWLVGATPETGVRFTFPQYFSETYDAVTNSYTFDKFLPELNDIAPSYSDRYQIYNTTSNYWDTAYITNPDSGPPTPVDSYALQWAPTLPIFSSEEFYSGDDVPGGYDNGYQVPFVTFGHSTSSCGKVMENPASAFVNWNANGGRVIFNQSWNGSCSSPNYNAFSIWDKRVAS